MACSCCSKCCTGCRKWTRNNLFLIFTIIGVTLGISLGIGLRYLDMTDDQIEYFQFPGDMLIRLLKMIILPLIVVSLISGCSSLEKTSTGWMGLAAVIYYMSTTILSVFLGIAVVTAMKPGSYGKDVFEDEDTDTSESQALDSILDLIRNIFPSNLIEACFQSEKTEFTPIYGTESTVSPTTTDTNSTSSSNNSSDENVTSTVTYITGYTHSVVTSSGMNTLGILVFSLIIGIIISTMKEDGLILVEFFNALNIAVLRYVTIIMWYTPIGIIFLIAGQIVEMDDPESLGKQLLMYTATVLAGLSIHALVVLPLILIIFARRNPFKYFAGATQAILTALATASSSGTLPITMRCATDNNHIDQRISKFVLPVGATINMDGTALYEAVAVIFISQVIGQDLAIGEIFIISITATLASIGAAGIPQAGLVTMLIVLNAVGLPVEYVSYILVIDWFLDRVRTSINVWGDCVGAAILDRFFGGDGDDVSTVSGTSGRGRDVDYTMDNGGFRTGPHDRTRYQNDQPPPNPDDREFRHYSLTKV